MRTPCARSSTRTKKIARFPDTPWPEWTAHRHRRVRERIARRAHLYHFRAPPSARATRRVAVKEKLAQLETRYWNQEGHNHKIQDSLNVNAGAASRRDDRGTPTGCASRARGRPARRWSMQAQRPPAGWKLECAWLKSRWAALAQSARHRSSDGEMAAGGRGSLLAAGAGVPRPPICWLEPVERWLFRDGFRPGAGDRPQGDAVRRAELPGRGDRRRLVLETANRRRRRSSNRWPGDRACA